MSLMNASIAETVETIQMKDTFLSEMPMEIKEKVLCYCVNQDKCNEVLNP